MRSVNCKLVKQVRSETDIKTTQVVYFVQILIPPKYTGCYISGISKPFSHPKIVQTVMTVFVT